MPNKDLCKFERKVLDAVDLDKAFESFPINIPGLVELKKFMREEGAKEKLPYGIPTFISQNSTIIILRLRAKQKEDLLTLVNPMLLSSTGLIMSEETQYGVEGTYLVPRHPKIEIMFSRLPDGEASRQVLVGKTALEFQQAFQALSGIFICDIGLRIDNNEEYKSADEAGKNELVHAYMKALSEITEEAVSTDKKVKDYVDATQFLADKIEKSVEEEIESGQEEIKS